MKIVGIGQNGAPGAARIEINHGVIEAETLCDPERA